MPSSGAGNPAGFDDIERDEVIEPTDGQNLPVDRRHTQPAAGVL
jgi:hypothetical protein